MSQWTFRAAGTPAGSASGNALAVSLPASVASGELLRASIYWEPDTNTVTPPAGWTSVKRQTCAGKFMLEVFERRADGTEGATATWTPATNAQWREGIIEAYTGGTGSGPCLDVADGASGVGSLNSAQLAPSVTTLGPDRLVTVTFATFSGAIPTGFTGAVTTRHSGGPPAIGSAAKAVAGATGTTGVTGTGTEDWAAITAAFISDQAGDTSGTDDRASVQDRGFARGFSRGLA